MEEAVDTSVQSRNVSAIVEWINEHSFTKKSYPLDDSAYRPDERALEWIIELDPARLDTTSSEGRIGPL